MKRIFTIVILLIVAGITSLSGQELPQVKELMVVGYGEMIEGNLGRARQDAILNALREAVRISLLEFSPPTVLEENAAALDIEIFSRVTEYVETFKIVSETGGSDGHQVLLQAQVDLHKLRSSLLDMGLLEQESSQEEVVQVRMILAEVSRYPWYREFEDFLREDLSFIKGVRLRSVMTGEFTMEIELVGDIQTLIYALATKEFDGFILEVNQTLEDQVMVRFRPRETLGS
jgi:hypothetical protein